MGTILLITTVTAFIFGCTAADVATSREVNMAKRQDPIEEIHAALAGYKTAYEAGDIGKIMAAYSDGYSNPEGTDKSGLRAYFNGFDPRLFPATTVGISECEIAVDGKSATASPVSYDSPLGLTLLQYRMKREANAVWRFVYSEEIPILRTGRSKVLEDVPIPPWGEWEESSVIAALTSMFSYSDDPLSYDYLMGTSGHAFRLQVELGIAGSGLDPSAPHAAVGFNCMQALADTLGYDIKSYKITENDPSSLEVAKKAAMESIDKGIPVLHQTFEAGVIVGYYDSGKAFLEREWQDTGEETKAFRKLRMGIEVFTKTMKRPAKRDIVREALERAVMLAETDLIEGHYNGFKAYEIWSEWLRDEKRDEYFMGNGWIYVSLKSARKSAYQYLEEIAAEFDAKTSAAILKAAALYEEVYDALGDEHKIAPGPWDIKEEEWSQDVRNAQADVLDRASEKERLAVQELKNILALMK